MFVPEKADDGSTRAHRQLIGTMGLILPVLLWFVSGWRPTDGLADWKVLGSLSAYYYTGAVVAFAGILVALAFFLFTYRGYTNAYGWRDRAAAVVAGLAAITVAFFPTDPPSGLAAPSWWNPAMATLHYTAAVTLLVAFAYIALFLFPRTNAADGGRIAADKLARNWIYRICGIGIVVSILWAGASLFTGASIFWPEVFALEFFAVSWLVKGRTEATIAALGRRTAFYGRHPTKLLRRQNAKSDS